VTWVDSHCHLQEQFVADGDPTAAQSALQRARSAGVTGVICVGTDQTTSVQAIALARAVHSGDLGESLPQVRAVIGLHPHEATQSRTWISELVAEQGTEIAGIGECGLDYFYDHAPKAEQRQAFVDQIGIAHEAKLPLIIHARDAWEDLFAILDGEGVPQETVLHCFTGGPDEAAGCIERGINVSFSGIVTFKNAQPTRDAVRVVPAERLLVETDSPFLAPTPHRGQTNEPAYVALVGRAVAEAAGHLEGEIAASSTAVAERVFGLISPDPSR